MNTIGAIVIGILVGAVGTAFVVLDQLDKIGARDLKFPMFRWNRKLYWQLRLRNERIGKGVPGIFSRDDAHE